MRVVTTHFGKSLRGSQLTSSTAFTVRHIGMISCTLGRVDVPRFVLDSAVHHELRDKELGMKRQDSWMKAHSRAFWQGGRSLDRRRQAGAILQRVTGES